MQEHGGNIFSLVVNLFPCSKQPLSDRVRITQFLCVEKLTDRGFISNKTRPFQLKILLFLSMNTRDNQQYFPWPIFFARFCRLFLLVSWLASSFSSWQGGVREWDRGDRGGLENLAFIIPFTRYKESLGFTNKLQIHFL